MPLSLSSPLALLITEVIIYHISASQVSRFNRIIICTFFCLAFVQDSHPPLEDPWSFPAANLLLRSNLWPRPAAASARGGDRWASECTQFGCFPFKLRHETVTSPVFPVQVIMELRERPDRAAKARRGLTLSLQPLKGFDYDSLLSPPATPHTQLDSSANTHTAAPLPGPAFLLHPAHEKGPRREVFV